MKNKIIFFMLIYSSFGFSGVITPVDGNNMKEQKLSNGELANFIYVNSLEKSNKTARVKFLKYQQDHENIYIVNNPILNSDLKGNPLNLTIIENESDLPMKLGKIEILGKRSDLLIISKSGILCDSCEFKNIDRLTIAAGGLNNAGDKIVTKGAEITIQGRGLRTYGADVVDLLAEKISIEAPVSTFEKVSKNKNGTYSIETKSDLIAGQTSLNLVMGNYVFDYKTLDSIIVMGKSVRPSSFILKSSIEANNINVKAIGDIVIGSSDSNDEVILNTKSDVVIAGQVEGKPIITNGTIKIESYNYIKIKNALLKSSSDITLKGKEVRITPNDSYHKESIISDVVNVIAINEFRNSGLIDSGDINVSADVFSNLGGEIFTYRDVFIDANKTITNNNRGMIVGNNVFLQSGALIQNGIKEPWRCQSIINNVLKMKVSPHHINSDKVELGFGAGLITDNPIYKCNPKTSRMILWDKSEREGYILGFNVALNSPQVINSNPHVNFFSSYEDYRKRFLVDSNKNTGHDVADSFDSDLVTISAENSMLIKSKASVQNGSGTIEVFNGDLNIDTSSFHNQRFYISGDTHVEIGPWRQPFPMSDECKIKEEKFVHAIVNNSLNVKKYTEDLKINILNVNEIIHRLAFNMVAPQRTGRLGPDLTREFAKFMKEIGPTLGPVMKSCKEYIKPKVRRNQKITVETKQQYLKAISPPSKILVGRNLNIKANKMENLAGNIEILGDIKGNLTELKNLGLLLQKSKVEKTTTYHERRYCSKRILGKCIKRKTKRWTTTSDKMASRKPTDQLPAFFYLGSGELNVTGMKSPKVTTEGTVTTGNITYGKM